ncbi:hypothetical protein VPNG_07952 [Cytospora leucostoma]|uniref:Uncharacterized protein n=1 Tax=Cytospora leucostoma TaxID=1230097 RepID=A0A423WB13_9PEZI|nr:hypothetical protein VPNG_07952 [Cytospora leucostoma]
MASAEIPLILTLRGEPDKLVSKPDTYSELLQLARKPNIYFQQLQKFKDEEITFCFKWDDRKVQLDESALKFVHARARLRIVTPEQAHSVRSKHRAKSRRRSVKREPSFKRVKVEDSAAVKVRVEIDLTESDDAAPPPDGTSPVERAKGVHDISLQPDSGEQNVASNTATSQTKQTAQDSALITGATDELVAHSAGTIQKEQSDPLQPVAIPGLLGHNFAIGIGSPARTIRPQRQLIKRQYIDSEKPWVSTATPNHSTGSFSFRVLTEHNIIPCVFKSDSVHFNTVWKYLRCRGYPTNRPKFMRADGEKCVTGAAPLWRSGISEGRDVHVYRSDRPGIYILMPWDRSFLELSSEVSVALELRPGWKFSSVYPWTEIRTEDGNETAEWKVSITRNSESVSESGSEKYFGHISWETTVDAAFEPVADRKPLFNPAMPNMTPQNSVVLDRNKLLPIGDRRIVIYESYFYWVLHERMGLEMNIVQDFHDYVEAEFGDNIRSLEDRFSIAVSFVPQTHIDEAARLSITPRPYATARILMMFGTVDTTQEQGSWSAWAGRRRGLTDALREKDWASITGVRPDVLRDPGKFRAIEWGVMRVPEEHLIKK